MARKDGPLWKRKAQEGDNDIAPRDATSSIANLQRWAVAISQFSLSSGGPITKREKQSRLQLTQSSNWDHQQSDGVVATPYNVGQPIRVISQGNFSTLNSTSSQSAFARLRQSIQSGPAKRKRSTSPPLVKNSSSSQLDSYQHETKRTKVGRDRWWDRRIEEKMEGEDDDYDYANSTDWSFPSSKDEDEDGTKEKVAN